MRRLACVCLLACALACAGCAGGDTYAARFVRYERGQDGRRLAVVRPVARGETPHVQRAYCGIPDLRPGDEVRVRFVGRDSHQPAWVPDVVVVARADE